MHHDMAFTWEADHLHRLSPPLERRVELFGLLDGTPPILEAIQEQQRCADLIGPAQRRNPDVAAQILIGLAADLRGQEVPTDIRGAVEAHKVMVPAMREKSTRSGPLECVQSTVSRLFAA